MSSSERQDLPPRENNNNNNNNNIASIPEEEAATIHEEEIGECDNDDDDDDELQRIKWPCVLHKLIDEARDDDWLHVMERIQSHPEEVLIKNSQGLNALHEACVRYPPVKVISEMLKVAPTEPNKLKNREGETPLHLASYSASEEVQEKLCLASPESLAVQDRKYGDSPLHLAARARATYRLMETFVHSYPRSISIRNRRGATPFWNLRRSYLEAESIEEIMDEDGSDYRMDWDLMVLFLRVHYEATMKNQEEAIKEKKESLERQECDKSLPQNSLQFQFLMHAAAATPPCPRDSLRFLCRHFAEQAVQYDRQGMTPLLLAAKANVLPEPKFDETTEGLDDEPINNNNDVDDDRSVLPNIEDLALQSEAGEVGEEEEPESVLNVILDCNPKAASYADLEGGLPLAHALSTGKRWNAGVKQLIDACPRALECRDMSTHLHMFQLAAIHSPELDTVYCMVRNLPELLAFRDSAAEQQGATGEDDNEDAEANGNRKKRRG